MSLTLDLQTTKKRIAQAFNQRSYRHAFAMSLCVGCAIGALESQTLAQFNGGDLPASPWSKRVETPKVSISDSGNRSPNGRLHPPGSSFQRTATPSEMPTLDPPLKETDRPAPVTFMGPMLPRATTNLKTNQQDQKLATSSDPWLVFPSDSKQPNLIRGESPSIHTAASPTHALTQKNPIDAQSDWNRMQAGGQILEADNLTLGNTPELGKDPPRDRTASRVSRRIGLGLPEREADSQLLPSQMASAKTAAVRDEPLPLQPDKQSSTHEGDDHFDLEFESSRMSAPSRGQQHSKEIVTSGKKSSMVYPIQEVKPGASKNSTDAIATADSGARKASEPVNDESQMKRLALAQRVSHELLSTQPVLYARAPEALESLPGWQSVKRELHLRLERCDSLLKRGVVLSAREEASQGLLRLYRTMDMESGRLFSEPAYEKAMSALREEGDFQRVLVSRSGVQAIVDTHTTEALKGRPLDTTSPEMAASHYRWYARYQLIAASKGHPWAADLLYAFGKTLEKDAELNPDRANLFRNQAVVCYQAAMQIAPSQSDVANQLGFALIHLDRMDDAYDALTASLQQKPTANAWNNLAEIFRQRGATADAEYAVQQAAALNNGSPKYSSEHPEITAVDPAVFAKYSPMPTMASPTQNSTSNPLPTSAPNAYGANTQQANSGKRLFSKIFR